MAECDVSFHEIPPSVYSDIIDVANKCVPALPQSWVDSIHMAVHLPEMDMSLPSEHKQTGTSHS